MLYKGWPRLQIWLSGSLIFFSDEKTCEHGSQILLFENVNNESEEPQNRINIELVTIDTMCSQMLSTFYNKLIFLEESKKSVAASHCWGWLLWLLLLWIEIIVPYFIGFIQKYNILGWFEENLIYSEFLKKPSL